jgi:hypothetical protein
MPDAVVLLLRDMLKQKSPVPFTDDTKLVEIGLVDSMALLDLILEVENAGHVFQPEMLDLESGVSIRTIASAFVGV